MRILIATQTYYPGTNGQAVFSIGLAEELAKNGHQVGVVAPSLQGSPNQECKNAVEVFGIRALHLSPFHPTLYVTPFPRIGVLEALDDFQPQIVHIQDHYFISVNALEMALARDIPLLGTNHFLPDNISKNMPLVWGERLLNRMLWKWMLRTYDRVNLATTPSETAARILRQQGISVPVYPVSCGVDLNRFRPRPGLDRETVRRKYMLDPEDQVFMYVGRLDEEKRIDTLLFALQYLDRPEVKLLIVGWGGHRRSLGRLSRELNIHEQVLFAGRVPDEDLPDLYDSADIFMMPSPAELQSIATLEAMASGKPVLAADARALPELVTPGYNGYLFEAGDPQAIASSMAKMLESKDQWDEMGRHSLDFVQRHSIENTARIYAHLYNALLSGEPYIEDLDTALSRGKVVVN